MVIASCTGTLGLGAALLPPPHLHMALLLALRWVVGAAVWLHRTRGHCRGVMSAVDQAALAGQPQQFRHCGRCVWGLLPLCVLLFVNRFVGGAPLDAAVRQGVRCWCAPAL